MRCKLARPRQETDGDPNRHQARAENDRDRDEPRHDVGAPKRESKYLQSQQDEQYRVQNLVDELAEIRAMYTKEGKEEPKEMKETVYYNRGVLIAALQVEAIRNALKAKPSGKITGEDLKRGFGDHVDRS